MAKTIWSGEPLPIAPKIKDPELDHFVRKLLEYLRRLGAKLAQYPSGPGGGTSGTIPIFSAWLTADQTVDGTDVKWTAVLRRDAVYDHTLDPVGNEQYVTVLEDGFYLVHVDLEFDALVTFPVTVSVKLSDPVAATVAFSFDVVGQTGTYCGAIPLPLVAGVTLSIGLLPTLGSGSLLRSGSRLTILKLTSDSGGGSGTPPGSVGSGWTEPGAGGWTVAEV